MRSDELTEEEKRQMDQLFEESKIDSMTNLVHQSFIFEQVIANLRQNYIEIYQKLYHENPILLRLLSEHLESINQKVYDLNYDLSEMLYQLDQKKITNCPHEEYQRLIEEKLYSKQLMKPFLPMIYQYHHFLQK